MEKKCDCGFCAELVLVQFAWKSIIDKLIEDFGVEDDHRKDLLVMTIGLLGCKQIMGTAAILNADAIADEMAKTLKLLLNHGAELVRKEGGTSVVGKMSGRHSLWSD